MKRAIIGDFFTKLISLLLIATLFLLLAGTGSAKIIYVEPGNSIEASINNSTAGDFIFVRSGVYQGNVTINVAGVTVSSDPENSGNVLVRAPDRNSSVFHIKTDNVTLKGFNITGSEEAGRALDKWDEIGCPPAGICLEHANNCTIEENNISKNRYGIYLQESMNNALSQNNLSSDGIWLDEGCSHNRLQGNVLEKGNIILGAQCWNNTIMQNRISNGEGISVACCGGNNLISNNVILNCSSGIDIYDVQARTIIRDNKIMNCNHGIHLDFVFDSRIYNNTISNNTIGVYLREECHNNELSNNTIIFSSQSGIYLLDNTANNRIFNNYFNNTVNSRVEDSEGNSWNTTKKKDMNIVEGPYLGGNFWANPRGTGFSQTANDSDSDGISDLPYKVNGSDFDHLPLVMFFSNPGVNITGINEKCVIP